MRAEREVRWPRLAAVLMIAAALACAGLAFGAKHAKKQAPVNSTLPAGEGRALAEQACLICHSEMLIAQQVKDSTGWEKTITQMERWGAPITPAQHDTVARYLRTHFGPRTKR